MKLRSAFFAFLLLMMLMALPSLASAQAPDYRSTEIHADRTITFRYFDPKASRVALGLENVAKAQAMTRNDKGLWSITVGPLAPDIYSYHFEVDGETRLDPRSTRYVQNLLFPADWLLVPGGKPEPWEVQAVPHGTLHRHTYTTKVVTGLAADQSEYYVYTPPDYDPAAKESYPVLYLLHGWSDQAGGWSELGRAQVILDNLIAYGKARPMVVVMPLGYGQMSFVESGFSAWNDRATVKRNVAGFERALLEELMPRVESGYRVERKPEGRAIAGLSMGGLESLTIGLNHPELFSWVGGFSAAVHDMNFADNFLKGERAQPRLLWIACGTEEQLIGPNRKLVSWLKEKGLAAEAVETPGMHDWIVWRHNLLAFAPRLFQR